MKKIALIMDGWKRLFTYAWPSGILQRLRENHEEASLYIFSSSGNWSMDEGYNYGEYNIYCLPDLEEFDGIILDINNIRYPSVRREIIRRARKSGAPVVSVSNAITGFYYAGIDNDKAIRQVLEHLYAEHGCRRYWFIMGRKNNYENARREMAIREYLQKREIPFSEEDFYFGSFEYECGVQGFGELYGYYRELPDAVVCASDNIAVGVCEAAKAAGCLVPEDFIVTGFDDFDKAECYRPSLTTVGYIREEVGCLAADILLRVWNGDKAEWLNFVDARPVFRESCGCEKDSAVDARGMVMGKLLYEIETAKFEEQVLSAECELMRCNTVEDMMECITPYMPFLHCDAMYVVLDDGIDRFHGVELERQYRIENETPFCRKGYPEKMSIRFAYEGGRRLPTGNEAVAGIFPRFSSEEPGTDTVFLPIHFRDAAVGYLVIRGAAYLMEKQYLFKVLNTLTTAMENLHRKEKLEHMNHALADLYVKDALTGLYNRFGHQRFGESYLKECYRRGEAVEVSFFDVDRLKYINDTFGHEYGDFAIKAVASAIAEHCAADAIPARTGGDEFILVQRADTRESWEEMVSGIRQEIKETQKRMKLPFELSTSVGVSVSDPQQSRTLEYCVREADAMMYQEKTAKKAARQQEAGA